jgi:hypothetical protein
VTDQRKIHRDIDIDTASQAGPYFSLCEYIRLNEAASLYSSERAQDVNHDYIVERGKRTVR